MVIGTSVSLGVLFYYKFRGVVKDEISTSYEQVVSQYVDNINYKLNIYQNLMENIVMNGTVQRIFLNQGQFTPLDTFDVGKQISNEIDSLIFGKNVKEIHSIRLYALNDSFPNDGRYVSNISTIRSEPWFGELNNFEEGSKYFFDITEGTKKQIISFIKPIVNIKSFRERMGFVKLDIDLISLFDVNSMLVNGKCENIYILAGNDGEVIAGSECEITFKDIDFSKLAGKDTGNQIMDIDGAKKILAYKNIEKYGWKALFVFPYSEVESKMMKAVIPIALIVLGILAVLVCLAILFSNFFSSRIYQLIRKMQKVQEGDLEITEFIQGKDEIGMVDAHFNTMVRKLGELINENYIQKLEKREAELNALQAQINPHFLYNALETINSISSLYGCSEVCDITQNLGEMFRYSINIGRNEFVRIEDEINHVRNYINIQMIRFDNRFSVYYGVPEELRPCRILKFILQPLVENVFVHGFKGKKDKGVIKISAVKKGDFLIINIEDNGKGMSEEQLSNLRTYLSEKESWIGMDNRRSIGIKNVNSRIKLTYGDKYGIKVESVQNQGTCVTVVLPYMI